MASIEKRGDSYRIKVSCGYKANGQQVTQKMTWTSDPKMTEKQIEKELQRQAILFEEECKHGQIVSAIKFEAFAEEWFEDYAKLNLKSTTYTRQRQLTKRGYAAIGHIRLDKLTTREIQKFINSLAKRRSERAHRQAFIQKNNDSLPVLYFNNHRLCDQDGYAQ